MGVGSFRYRDTSEQERLSSSRTWAELTAELEQHTSKTEATIETLGVKIVIAYDGCPRLQWFAKGADGQVESETPFLADSRSRAYAYEAVEGGVLHYVTQKPETNS